jgi:hypothetical protein
MPPNAPTSAGRRGRWCGARESGHRVQREMRTSSRGRATARRLPRPGAGGRFTVIVRPAPRRLPGGAVQHSERLARPWDFSRLRKSPPLSMKRCSSNSTPTCGHRRVARRFLAACDPRRAPRAVAIDLLNSNIVVPRSMTDHVVVPWLADASVRPQRFFTRHDCAGPGQALQFPNTRECLRRLKLGEEHVEVDIPSRGGLPRSRR